MPDDSHKTGPYFAELDLQSYASPTIAHYDALKRTTRAAFQNGAVMIKQILAIIFIYIYTAIAWGILGATVLQRTYSSDSANGERVNQLWGTAQNQTAPSFYYETKKQVKQTSVKDNKTVTEVVTESDRHYVPIDKSNVKAVIDLDYRKKGLLWYSTYKVHFSGGYKINNPTTKRLTLRMDFPLPAQQAIYDNFQLELAGKTVGNISPSGSQLSQDLHIEPARTEDVAVSYDSQGLTTWRYNFGSSVNQVKDFSMDIATNFDAIDFPEGSMSPSVKKKIGNGWELSWRYKNLITGYDIGVKMPEKLNPGPWVSKVTFFAPVSLFLFFFILFVFATIKGIRVHPMNYFFIGAAFFSFHLLLAYLVDHISVDHAFIVSSIVSIFLVVSYMRLVVSSKFAFVEVGISQLIYLVLFSYTFFFEQYTGLVVTIMCILTLFVLMQFTGRIDWSEAFRKASTKNSGPAKATV
jgi:inner membrane protein involved in colicin E2 resistance